MNRKKGRAATVDINESNKGEIAFALPRGSIEDGAGDEIVRHGEPC